MSEETTDPGAALVDDTATADAASIGEPPEEPAAGAPARRTRTRRSRLYPGLAFEEALFLGNAIQKHASGQEVRRVTLFGTLQKSPDSGPTRKLITASSQYGITSGSYSAEVLNLTEKGKTATDPSGATLARMKARIELAITGVAPFNSIYTKYQGGRLPTVQVLRDAALEADVDPADAAECVEIFLANARAVGLIRTIAGSEHLLSIADALDGVQDSADPVIPTRDAYADDANDIVPAVLPLPPAGGVAVTAQPMMENTCFVISPIGAPDSEQRRHADLVLSSLIEPAISELGLVPIRADKISKPGLITGQVIDHIARARMVIADLSFGNPNVYYELALRHALRRPVVQITRSSDPIPFDVGQFRTVVVDMTDIYSFVPQIDLHRQEIARQCRAALADGAIAENPLSHFYPGFWAHLPAAGANA